MQSSTIDLTEYERGARREGYGTIAGLDEVGRGPLAGPVVAACVVLPAGFEPEGIDDSKALTALQREKCYDRILARAAAYSVAQVEADEIDRVNILQATRLAMRLALSQLALTPDLVIVDGLPVPDLPCKEQRAIVRGDSRCLSIAAASIVAKVTRDRQMCAHHARYPDYGFDKHKGYSAREHLVALRLHGPCPLHRRSFAPVAAAFALREPLAGLFAVPVVAENEAAIPCPSALTPKPSPAPVSTMP